MKKKQMTLLPVEAILFLPVIIALLWVTSLAGDSGSTWNQIDSPAEEGGIYEMPAYVEGEVLVKVATHDSLLMEEINLQLGTTTKRFFPQLGIFLLETGEQDLSTLIYNLEQLPEVVWAEPNFEMVPLQSVQGSFALPDEASTGSYMDQPAATMLDLVNVHQLFTGSNVKVAVIDGGVDYNHPAFEGKVVSKFDYVDNDPDALDEPGGDNSGHGTFVAGVIHLMAPSAEIYAYRVSDIDGNGNGYIVAEAILQAIQDNCQIINLSLVTTGEHEAIASAIEFAKSYDVLVIAAAGNGQHETALYPACDPYVIAVGAVDQNTNLAEFSFPAEYVNIWAPGVDIYCPYQDDGYAWWSGTSFAAPFVTGQAALIYSQAIAGYPSRDWVVEAIISTTIEFSSNSPEPPANSGSIPGGVINPFASLNLETPLIAIFQELGGAAGIVEMTNGGIGSITMGGIFTAVDDLDAEVTWSVSIGESPSVIKAVQSPSSLPEYTMVTLDARDLDEGYYQDTVFCTIDGAYNSPLKYIYTFHVSEGDPNNVPPFHGRFWTSGGFDEFRMYIGQDFPIEYKVAVSAYQDAFPNYPVVAPYTIWQDENVEFITLIDTDSPPTGYTGAYVGFGIDAGESLPVGIYYDTLFCDIDGANNGPFFLSYTLTKYDGDSMWIELASPLPNDAIFELDTFRIYHYNFGEIDINSTRVDTVDIAIVGNGDPLFYEILPPTHMPPQYIEFIEVENLTGYTDDTVQFIFDWSIIQNDDPYIVVGGFNHRYFNIQVLDAINLGRGLSFEFTAVENSQATSGGENPEVVYNITNYPNPFNPVAKFSFGLSKTSHVRLDIYNILGQRIGTPIDQQYEAGLHSAEWNGSNHASGIYFYRISAGEFTETRKMILIK